MYLPQITVKAGAPFDRDHSGLKRRLLKFLFYPLSKQRERSEQSGQQGSHQGDHGDLGVNGRSCGILERIAHSVACHGCFMGRGAFASFVPGLHVLFGIVPKAAGIGHEQGQQKTADDIAQQKAADGGRTADETYQDGGENGCQAGGDQFFERAVRSDADTGVIVRFYAGTTFFEPFDFLKLAVEMGKAVVTAVVGYLTDVDISVHQ